jgi:Zn-dependent M28 family amino/carboxypeptidase
MHCRILCALILAGGLFGQADRITGDRIRPHVRFLSHDLLEGRGPGTRGGALTEQYLAAQFEAAGLKPAGDGGSYLQRVPLTSVELTPTPQLTLSRGGETIRPKWLDEFVGTSHAQLPSVTLNTETVFVGHGIVAPEFQWNDYAGADVKGKTVVLFTGEPPSDDPKFFGGKALTYYGRWTYKYEEANRQGAAAVLIIHTTPTASYGWQVLRANGRATPMPTRQSGQPALLFAGWVTEEIGQKIFAAEGSSVSEMLARADKPGFRPMPLKWRVEGSIQAVSRPIQTYNVVGMVEGADPQLKQEAVVLSAHWDHLGVGQPVDGDAIYNGAVDNATGCALLIEMARAWASLEPKPRRSALFVAVTAEESGLLGAFHFAANPPLPAGRLAANFNFDSYSPRGRVRDAVLNGYERTTLKSLVENVAERFQLTLKSDPRPEAGSYYRSDHFSFARAGVPAFSVNMGSDYIGKTPEQIAEIRKRFSGTYHQPTDEFADDWDFSGMEQAARFGFTLALEAANWESLPTWREGDEFLPTRQKSLAQLAASPR